MAEPRGFPRRAWSSTSGRAGCRTVTGCSTRSAAPAASVWEQRALAAEAQLAAAREDGARSMAALIAEGLTYELGPATPLVAEWLAAWRAAQTEAR